MNVPKLSNKVVAAHLAEASAHGLTWHELSVTHVVQVAKHTPELAQLVVGAGGVGALVDYVGSTKGNTRLPGIMALGYIAAFSETLGLSVIAEKGLVSFPAL